MRNQEKTFAFIFVSIIFIVFIGRAYLSDKATSSFQQFDDELQVVDDVPAPAVLKDIIERDMDECHVTELITNTKRTSCDKIEKYGDEVAHMVCEDNLPKTKESCLVYSFGINTNFEFDNKIVHQCEVHSFDPTKTKDNAHAAKEVIFAPLSIGAIDFTYNIGGKIWDIRSLESITGALGHERRRINVLKLDVKQSEWTVLQWLTENKFLASQIDQLVLALYYHDESDDRCRIWRRFQSELPQFQLISRDHWLGKDELNTHLVTLINTERS